MYFILSQTLKFFQKENYLKPLERSELFSPMQTLSFLALRIDCVVVSGSFNEFSVNMWEEWHPLKI